MYILHDIHTHVIKYIIRTKVAYKLELRMRFTLILKCILIPSHVYIYLEDTYPITNCLEEDSDTSKRFVCKSW